MDSDIQHRTCFTFLQTLVYETPAAANAHSSFVFFKVANRTLTCSTEFSYSPDPEFTGFVAMRVGNNVRVILQVRPLLLIRAHKRVSSGQER